MFGIFFGASYPPRVARDTRSMKRIAVISSDKALERAVVAALECAGGGSVEVVAASAGEAAACDTVVVLGAAEFASGRLSAASLRDNGANNGANNGTNNGAAMRRPEIYVISWQHSEQTVLGLLEGGVDQYMTFPLSLRRLCLKVLRE